MRDAAGGIVGERAGIAAHRMSFEPAIGVEIACVHLAIFPTSSFYSLDQVDSRMTQAYSGYLLNSINLHAKFMERRSFSRQKYQQGVLHYQTPNRL
ncbi:MAG: hypothetical protein V9G16_06140 [Nitrosomonas sp.]